MVVVIKSCDRGVLDVEQLGPLVRPTWRFEIGVGVFIGWAGSTLLVAGGLVISIFSGMEGCQSRYSEGLQSALIFLMYLLFTLFNPDTSYCYQRYELAV